MSPLQTSLRVRAEHFDTDWLKDRTREMKHEWRLHRKLWEFVVIAQVYEETIGKGGMALGFGCGREPLPAWLASRDCRVIASDQALESAGDWIDSSQHSSGLEELPFEGICDEARFRDLVKYAPMDMREIPTDLLAGQFDFTWSAGSFEHIGGIEAGLNFFLEQMKCLKPGGIAAHTTEFNFASDTSTITSNDLVFFRKRDLESLARRVEAQGDEFWPLDLVRGNQPADLYVDPHPYTGPYHLNLMVSDHVSTSILLVARRGGGS